MPDDHGHPYEIWDVFTDRPLEGNPLGVFPRAEELPSRLYQPLARELNLSETVFILPDDPSEADAWLRIFTPTAELPFAGHPTLGAAFAVAGETGRARVRLRTGMGVVTVTMTRDEHGELVAGEMVQPVPVVETDPPVAALLGALGIAEASLAVELYTNGPSHAVVAVADRTALAALSPDLGALGALGPLGVAVIAPPLGAGWEQVGELGRVDSRNFCPGLGVPEDPATGSAAGPVAVHLLRHGVIVSGQTLEIRQGVEIARPSRLLATAEGDAAAITAVRVSGSAIRVARGHYRVG